MPRHILLIGAHPDDCDFSSGGSAILWARRGDRVKFVSITNGDAGHYYPEYIQDRSTLADRRMREAQAAVDVFGGGFECVGVQDGEVYVTRRLTHALIRLIRSFGEPGWGPDLVITNRPNDYHRDHRYTAQAVLDASYVLTVPTICADVPHLARMPVFAYWSDGFREGGAFRPDVVVPIEETLELKTRMAVQHESQIFEWLPYNAGRLEDVPEDEAGRREFAEKRLRARGGSVFGREGVQEKLAEQRRRAAKPLSSTTATSAPTETAASDAPPVEAFQISEYGRQPSAEELRELFPI